MICAFDSHPRRRYPVIAAPRVFKLLPYLWILTRKAPPTKSSCETTSGPPSSSDGSQLYLWRSLSLASGTVALEHGRVASETSLADLVTYQ